MLIAVFVLSLVLVILEKYQTLGLPLSPAVRKGLVLTGEFGLGVFIGFSIYTHGTELSLGLIDGLRGK